MRHAVRRGGRARANYVLAPVQIQLLRSTDQSASRWDVFMGYSYLAPHGSVTTDVPPLTYSNSYSAINYGAIGSVSYFFNRYAGGQIEYANHPNGANDGISTARLASFSGIPPKECRCLSMDWPAERASADPTTLEMALAISWRTPTRGDPR